MKVCNLLRNIIGVIGKKRYLNTLPSYLQIDPSKTCNISCPDCVLKSDELSVKTTKFAKQSFFRLIDEVYRHTLIIALYLVGEPFLNKDIFEMIKYAHKRRMYLFLSSNFNIKVDEPFATKIVTSGLDALIISVSGFSNEIHTRKHKGGDIEVIKENIKQLQEIKKVRNSRYPKIAIRYLLAKYNMEEMKYFSNFSLETGVDFFEVSLMTFSDENDPESLHEKKANKNKVCYWPWLMLGIHSDGKVQPCCYYFHEPPVLGNVSDQSLKEMWNSKIQQQFRGKMIEGGKNSLESCRKCKAFLGYQRKMYRKEIE